MKRSEMVNLIRSVIILDDATNGMAPVDRPELPELLLQYIEKAGMLPPMLPIPEFQFQAEHKWEPEREFSPPLSKEESEEFQKLIDEEEDD